MKLALHLLLERPWCSLLVLLALLVGGLSEAIGITALLPLLALTTGGPAPPPGSLGGLALSAIAFLGLPSDLGAMLFVLVAAMFLRGALTYIALVLAGHTVAQIASEIRLSLVQSIAEAKWEYFIQQSIGEFGNAIAQEADRTSHAYSHVFRLAAYVIQIGVYTVIAFFVDWRVTVLAALGGILVMAVFRPLTGIIRRAATDQRDALRDLTRRLADILGGIKPIKAMGMTDWTGPILTAELRKLFHALIRLERAGKAYDAFREPVIVALMAVGLYAATRATEMPFATLLVMALVFYRVTSQLAQTQHAFQQLAHAEAFYRSVQARLTAAAASREEWAGTQHHLLTERIQVVNVSFAFGEQAVLRDVSLEIPVGRLVTLTGRSGAGKTTLSDLILGLYQPDQGAILIDGIPLNAIDRKVWRQQIGYVPQDTFLLSDTVLANVVCGDPRLTEQDAINALRAAEAWDFVAQLPEGLQTLVGERGTRFSGGQRQRIAIARALIRKPRLLILDEPTTALDPSTERAFCETLVHLKGQMTILAVSHQAALTEVADQVFSFVDGRLMSAEVPSAAHSRQRGARH